MRRFLTALACAVLLGAPSFAQVVRVPVLSEPVVPVFRGPVVSEINSQLKPLLAAETVSQLKAAFQANIAPTPVAATPAVFAARAAITQAVAAPQTALPELVKSLRAAGGEKAHKAADRLTELGEMLAKSKDGGKSLVEAAQALNERFDGAVAAPGEAVDLSLVPTNDEDGVSEKKAAKKLKKEVKKLNALEDILAAAKTQSVLVVIQGMDTAHKDGVIKHGMTGLNPAFVDVNAFKKPTPEEAAQDFLVRIKAALPKPGIIGVFNRSHYEDIIVPTAWETMPGETIEARYARINAFELELARRGIKIVKVFLHISKDVQRERLQRRIDRPDKNWKFSMYDLETRKKWDPLQKVFGSILARTSTWYAPWHVLAADDKPRVRLDFTKLLRKTMSRMGLKYPESPDLKGVVVPK
ncbi:MAG: hypothetical protein HY923_02830 [Elusimicrobia bacterium]|nr:hypothetical protein [Elusimicrobiota bacterium]